MTADHRLSSLWSDFNLMNLIIDPNPQNDQHSLNGALASRLAKALGGETKTIRIYDANQGYFNYQFEQNWIDLILESSNLIFPVPMWNYSIPASLKDFVDKTTKKGALWDFDDNRDYVGLLKNKAAFIIMTSGDVIPPGSTDDFVTPYLKKVLVFWGVSKTKIYRLGGVRSKNLVTDNAFMDEKTTEMFHEFGLKT